MRGVPTAFDLHIPFISAIIVSMEEIKKDLLDGEDEDDSYMDRLREVSGTGLVNTRISDRESEVRKFTPAKKSSQHPTCIFRTDVSPFSCLVSIKEASTDTISQSWGRF